MGYFDEMMTEIEKVYYECLPSDKKEIEDIVKKTVKNRKDVKNITNAIYKCKNKGIDHCRKYWSNPYEGENSVREYEENIKFCEENIRIINSTLSFEKSKKMIRYLNSEKENFEKEIERWQKLIESKMVNTKTEIGKIVEGDNFENSKDCKNNKTVSIYLTLAVIVLFVITIGGIFLAKYQKVENPNITNTTETSVEFEQK